MVARDRVTRSWEEGKPGDQLYKDGTIVSNTITYT